MVVLTYEYLCTIMIRCSPRALEEIDVILYNEHDDYKNYCLEPKGHVNEMEVPS